MIVTAHINPARCCFEHVSAAFYSRSQSESRTADEGRRGARASPRDSSPGRGGTLSAPRSGDRPPAGEARRSRVPAGEGRHAQRSAIRRSLAGEGRRAQRSAIRGSLAGEGRRGAAVSSPGRGGALSASHPGGARRGEEARRSRVLADPAINPAAAADELHAGAGKRGSGGSPPGQLSARPRPSCGRCRTTPLAARAAGRHRAWCA